LEFSWYLLNGSVVTRMKMLITVVLVVTIALCANAGLPPQGRYEERPVGIPGSQTSPGGGLVERVGEPGTEVDVIEELNPDIGEPGPPAPEDFGEEPFGERGGWPYAPGPELARTSGREMGITGYVRVNVPTGELPENSCLRIKLVDASRMDASSTTIVEEIYDLEGQEIEEKFPYEIWASKPANDELWRRYQLQAVLNIGWCKEPGSSTWIKQGDYNNDWAHPIYMTEEEDEYEKDIKIKKYIHG